MSGPFTGWKCNFDHFLGEVWLKIIFSWIEWIKIISKSGKHKKMKVHSVKKRYPWKSTILWGFWSKTDFPKKKRSKLISDMWCRRCVSYIRHMFFINTDVWTLSQKNLSRFKEPFWWFIIYLFIIIVPNGLYKNRRLIEIQIPDT